MNLLCRTWPCAVGQNLPSGPPTPVGRGPVPTRDWPTAIHLQRSRGTFPCSRWFHRRKPMGPARLFIRRVLDQPGDSLQARGHLHSPAQPSRDLARVDKSSHSMTSKPLASSATHSRQSKREGPSRAPLRPPRDRRRPRHRRACAAPPSTTRESQSGPVSSQQVICSSSGSPVQRSLTPDINLSSLFQAPEVTMRGSTVPHTPGMAMPSTPSKAPPATPSMASPSLRIRPFSDTTPTGSHGTICQPSTLPTSISPIPVGEKDMTGNISVRTPAYRRQCCPPAYVSHLGAVYPTCSHPCHGQVPQPQHQTQPQGELQPLLAGEADGLVLPVSEDDLPARPACRLLPRLGRRGTGAQTTPSRHTDRDNSSPPSLMAPHHFQ